MNSSEWLTSADPRAMLAHLGDRADPRRLRLFACACVRQIWDAIDEGNREAVENAEDYAEGKVAQLIVCEDIVCAHSAADAARYTIEWAAAGGSPARRVSAGLQADIIREIFANPFAHLPYVENGELWVPEPGNPTPGTRRWTQAYWLTPTVLTLARHIHDTGDWSGMGLLWDALSGAGCEDEAIRRHLMDEEPCPWCEGAGAYRPKPFAALPVGTNPVMRNGIVMAECVQCGGTGKRKASHARGCWVLGLLLGGLSG